MISDRKICLLLGAGASHHLGFPLGSGLQDRILRKLEKLKKAHDVRLEEEYHTTHEDVELFQNKLGFGDCNSPDAFLEKNPMFLSLGKLLICEELASLEIPQNVMLAGGWYKKLVAAIRVEKVEDFKKNKLTIVTFNYDRSIDYRIHKYLEHTFDLDSQTAWEILQESIEIIHLHGTLGNYPHCAYGEKGNIPKRSEAIKVVHEVEDGLDQFKRASLLLNEADRVVVFGFGFGEDNVRRLNFFREQKKEVRDIVIGTGSFPGKAALRENGERLRRWGLEHTVHHFDHTCNAFFDHRPDPFK